MSVKFDRGLADMGTGIQDALRIAHRADPEATERALERDGMWAIARDLKLDGQIRNAEPKSGQLGLPLSA
jgi:hypothetical protein